MWVTTTNKCFLSHSRLSNSTASLAKSRLNIFKIKKSHLIRIILYKNTKIIRVGKFPDFLWARCAYLKTLIGGRFEEAMSSPAYSQFPPNARHNFTSFLLISIIVIILHVLLLHCCNCKTRLSRKSHYIYDITKGQ